VLQTQAIASPARTVAGVLVAAGVPGGAHASRGPSDNSAFTLLNPTPRALMRPMSTDRPDTTESPYTVDAGHVQLEMSIAEFAREDDGPRTDTLTIAPMNLKVGLLNNADLQFGFAPAEREDGDGSGATPGPSDLGVRLKWNLWGNDGGPTALALMPFVALPTDGFSSGHVEGGLIVPLAVQLTDAAALGLMGEVDFVFDEDRGEHVLEFLHTATIGFAIVGPLGGFVEYAGTLAESGSGYRASANAGLTYGLGPNLILDAGLNAGLTRAADDIVVFAGVSVRY